MHPTFSSFTLIRLAPALILACLTTSAARGAELPKNATPVLAADDTPGIFNGVYGADSDWVSVSAVSPSLLLSQVEVLENEKYH